MALIMAPSLNYPLDMTSLALVVLDTLRKDLFDEYFGWLPGYRFEAAYSTANWTGPAHASMFTGKYGSAVDVSSKSPSLSCDRPVLPELLADRGVRTRAWSANPNVSRTTSFDRGFTEFVGPSDLKTGDRNILDITEFAADHADRSRPRRYGRAVYETITGEYETLPSLWYGLRTVAGTEPRLLPDDGASVIARRLRDIEVDAEEFLYLNLMEAHTPYFPPGDYRDFDAPVRMPFGDAYFGVDDPDLARRGYRCAVRYLSDSYREIFGLLSDQYDVVITVSDHGELLGEYHDMWNHVSGIYPELTHVPLVVSGDGRSGHTDELVSLLDLFPTILRQFGVEPPPSDGREIPGEGTEDPYLAEYRGPFQYSLDRADDYDFELTQFDRDFYALIEPGYYGYQDYDGWRALGSTDRQAPQRTLETLVTDHGMESLVRESGDIGATAESRLADLGYI